MQPRTSQLAANQGARGLSLSSQANSRGGIQKRRGALPRVDKDGDLDMEAGTGTSDRRSRAKRPRSDRMDIINDHPTGSRTNRGANRNTPRGPPKKDSFSKGSRAGSGVLNSSHRAQRSAEANQSISILGWRQSKAAANPDNGVSNLIEFLERKAKGSGDAVKITQSSIEGDNLIVMVKAKDAQKVLRLNTYTFAGAVLSIQPVGSEEASSVPACPELSESAQETKAILLKVLQDRYDPMLKLLNLAELGKDAELVKLGTFDQRTTTMKFFPTLMALCNEIFANREEKRNAILSVSLARNDLTNISLVYSLASTFPDLKNLDLSNNKLADMQALEGWRTRFQLLEVLLLNGNPIASIPGFESDLMDRYPLLYNINEIAIRPIPSQIAQAQGVQVPAPQGQMLAPQVVAPQAVAPQMQSLANLSPYLQLPASGNPSPDEMHKQLMELEMCRVTGMVRSYSRLCLEEFAWNYDVALQKFQEHKDNLPKEAFHGVVLSVPAEADMDSRNALVPETVSPHPIRIPLKVNHEPLWSGNVATVHALPKGEPSILEARFPALTRPCIATPMCAINLSDALQRGVQVLIWRVDHCLHEIVEKGNEVVVTGLKYCCGDRATALPLVSQRNPYIDEDNSARCEGAWARKKLSY
ncbi:MAG: nuclear mRNA export, poly(A)+RNA binding protein [Trizodia sp. TS-e1964]|nr:MAG: nuclear mRNA export, poly(A)+RNA binding protein [Trizodia sp. TS-e1964]